MMTKQELFQCAQADIRTSDPESLVDLQDVTIDCTLPVAQRMNRFLEQIGNPYLFKVDGIVIKVHYGSKTPLSTALAGLLMSQ